MVAQSVRTVPGRKALLLSGALLLAGLTAAPGHAAVKFETNVKNALARSAKEHKPIMMDVYTDWCGWCHKLDKDVYSRADVTKAVHGGFIALKINPEKDKASEAFVGKYGVEGFPTILFIDSNGKEIYRSVGYRPGPEFLKELKAAKAKNKKAPAKATARK